MFDPYYIRTAAFPSLIGWPVHHLEIFDNCRIGDVSRSPNFQSILIGSKFEIFRGWRQINSNNSTITKANRIIELGI
jgi:hypothetical protein